jgi:hypothetical protein
VDDGVEGFRAERQVHGARRHEGNAPGEPPARARMRQTGLEARQGRSLATTPQLVVRARYRPG